ncbi:fructosamine-3-kinase [Mucilaginibacter oryzae]|uniref:Fructosamine-3-kinase n=1 Tax=Mucilaginibacter oryzae TaxID=468058 RepID=A0A316HFT7_9SPHI|nr:fructosamine kinase family protein [Mucilaginibacter oryzae]PWK78911.1 fructosamine-3-kinase [Mucilaginibacter oryzae]
MSVSAGVINAVKRKLNVDINAVHQVSGGDINEVYRLQASDRDYLIKINNRYKYPEMFKREAEGLAAIKATETIAVPDVFWGGETEDESFLLMEWINTVQPSKHSSTDLGIQLAQMHRCTAAMFGFDTDNYMGSLHQSNKRHHTWSKFFIEERLQPMVKIGFDKQELTKADVHLFDELYKKLPSLFDEELPSLIHGDLWGGNYMISVGGKPYLIDPAVSYGNREFDIAMTTLFGGFDNAFYLAYHEAFPLQAGWRQRLKLWNLYPLLVHVTLFGGGYARQVRENLAGFI